MRQSPSLNASFLAVLSIIVAGAFMRVLMIAPNVAPVAAIALFSGAHVRNRSLAFLIPLASMILSDVVLKFHGGMMVVYLAMMLVVMIGMQLRDRVSGMNVVLASVSASVVFFLVTNFALFFWTADAALYPHTWEGITASYEMALPFFRNTLLGDLFFSAVMFGGYALLLRKFPKLRIA